MRRSETAGRCACGGVLPYRAGRGRKPAVCEDCRFEQRARAQRARYARKKALSLVAPSGRLPCGEPEGAGREHAHPHPLSLAGASDAHPHPRGAPALPAGSRNASREGPQK